MTEEDTVQCWLVEREYTDKGLVTLVYAPTDGEWALIEQKSAVRLGEVTAGREVRADQLTAVDEPEERDRYEAEASRMADRHDQDDAV